MERRERSARSKSRAKAQEKKKENETKSPARRGRPPNPVKDKSPRSLRPRGRPRQTEKKETRDRSRSVSESPRRSRRSLSRRRNTPKKKDSDFIFDDETPLIEYVNNKQLSLVLEDLNKLVPLDQAVRRSVEKEVVRRSTRISTRSPKEEVQTKPAKNNLPVVKEEEPIPKEFGGVFGALFSALLEPILVFGLSLLCTASQCSIDFSSVAVPKNLNYYFNKEVALIVVTFIIIQAAFAAIPIGRVIIYDGKKLYRSNGFLAMVLTGGSVAAAWHQGVNITRTYEYFVKMLVAAYGLAIIIAIFLYFKARKASLADQNKWGNTNSRIYNFIAGRELNPIVFGCVNVKIVLLRTCVIASLLIDALVALKHFEIRKDWSPTLNIIVALKAVYCLDVLWFEESFSSTFQSQYEGVGLLQVQGLLLYPFYSAILPRFILAYNVRISTAYLAAAVVVFFIGYIIYRSSNLAKAAFRKVPRDPAFSKYDTIKTSGKELLVGGWWGVVKHPNYTGDILMHWAAASLVGFTHALPYAIPLLTTIHLVYRAKRDGDRCQYRYKGAWDEYHQRVPYTLVPYVY